MESAFSGCFDSQYGEGWLTAGGDAPNALAHGSRCASYPLLQGGQFSILHATYKEWLNISMEQIRKVCELAMKTLRTDLSASGRIDILERVMPYRGGMNFSIPPNASTDA